VFLADVFISFVQEDEAVAQAVKELIEHSFGSFLRSGVFLSSDRLTPGEKWMDRIKRELNECSVVVSLLSKRPIDRSWVKLEGGAAWTANKLLPVYFGNLTVNAIPEPFSELQAVNLLKNPQGLIQGVNGFLLRADHARGSRASVFGFGTSLNEDSAARLRDVLNTFDDAK
jgi:TIR domain